MAEASGKRRRLKAKTKLPLQPNENLSKQELPDPSWLGIHPGGVEDGCLGECQDNMPVEGLSDERGEDSSRAGKERKGRKQVVTEALEPNEPSQDIGNRIWYGTSNSVSFGGGVECVDTGRCWLHFVLRTKHPN